MSATLNHEKFSDFLGGCPVIEIPGQVYPVKQVYCDYVGTKDLQIPNYLNKVCMQHYLIYKCQTISTRYVPNENQDDFDIVKTWNLPVPIILLSFVIIVL